MLFLFCAAAFANDGPSPRLWAEAQGASVNLTVALFTSGEPGTDASYDLVRVDGETIDATLLSGHTFATSDAVGPTGTCRYWDDPKEGYDCVVTPEICSDCDLDGVPECAPDGVCLSGLLFEVTDDCVLPGDWGWSLREAGDDWGFDATATVDDVGQECATDTGDGGSGDDSGPTTDGGGCGCGTTAPGTALGVGMVLLGLATRRRG